MSVYLYDLDNLKQINDTFGHAEGDQIIRKFGELLHSYSRGSDILARFGGDEFVVIMKQMGSEQAVQRKGEEICRAFRESCRTEEVKAACSVGIAICKQEEESIPEMIVRADEALYRAKLNNKGGCCLWRP